jgi:DNA-binding transcriptional LysR family regulator
MPRSPTDWDARIGRRFKLRDLHILFAVVRAGSMAKAALQLGVTQPAISQAIGDLEATLGVRLLDRGPRGVTLTLFGDALLKRGAEALDALKQGIRDIEFLADPSSGEVWIGASESYISGGYLSAIVTSLMRRSPRIVVHVVEANTAALEFHELRARKVDLMIGRVSGQIGDDDLRIEPLYDEAIVVAAGRDHRHARRRKLDLNELADDSWILAPPHTVVRDLVGGAFRAQGMEPPRLSITTYSMQLRMQLLSSGGYVSPVPESLLHYNADRWSLCALPVTLGQPLPVVIVTLKDRTLSPVVELFIEHARTVTREMRTGGPSRAR